MNYYVATRRLNSPDLSTLIRSQAKDCTHWDIFCEEAKAVENVTDVRPPHFKGDEKNIEMGTPSIQRVPYDIRIRGENITATNLVNGKQFRGKPYPIELGGFGRSDAYQWGNIAVWYSIAERLGEVTEEARVYDEVPARTLLPTEEGKTGKLVYFDHILFPVKVKRKGVLNKSFRDIHLTWETEGGILVDGFFGRVEETYFTGISEIRRNEQINKRRQLFVAGLAGLALLVAYPLCNYVESTWAARELAQKKKEDEQKLRAAIFNGIGESAVLALASRYPDDPAFLLDIGDYYWLRGDLSKSEEYYVRAEQNGGDHYAAYSLTMIDFANLLDYDLNSVLTIPYATNYRWNENKKDGVKSALVKLLSDDDFSEIVRQNIVSTLNQLDDHIPDNSIHKYCRVCNCIKRTAFSGHQKNDYSWGGRKK